MRRTAPLLIAALLGCGAAVPANAGRGDAPGEALAPDGPARCVVSTYTVGRRLVVVEEIADRRGLLARRAFSPGEPAAVERWWRDPSDRIERSVSVRPPPDAAVIWTGYRYDDRSRLTERREERTDGVTLETRTLEGDVTRSWNELDPCPQLLPEEAWEIVEPLEALRDVAGGDGAIHAKIHVPLEAPTEWHATIRAGRPVECHRVFTTGDIRSEIVHRYGWSAEGIASVDRNDTWTAPTTPGPPSSVVVERAGGVIARVTRTHRERTEHVVTRDGAGRVASVGTGSPESFTGFRMRYDAEGREIERTTWEGGTLDSTTSKSFTCPTPLPAMPPGVRR